jgi:hypothetical protein
MASELIARSLMAARRDSDGLVRLADLCIHSVSQKVFCRRPDIRETLVPIKRGASQHYHVLPEESARALLSAISPKDIRVRGGMLPNSSPSPPRPSEPPSEPVALAPFHGHEPESTDMNHQLSTVLGYPVTFQLRTTPSGELALIDVAIIFTGLNNNHAGFAVRRLLQEYPEFHSSIVKFKFSGRGRQTIDVAPLATAIEFAFLLPGRAAANIRRQAAMLMVRYLGGDTTLVEEVYSNRRSQESLSAIPKDQRTVQEQAARLCGEAIEARTQPDLPALTSEQAFVPRKPLVIQDEDSVGLPGNDHLYAANRVGENIIKVGISKDVLERLKSLSQKFDGQYELLAVWPHESVLEDIVMDLLKPSKAHVGSSREHFNANATFEYICQIVQAARNLYRLKMDLEASGSKRKREEMEFESEMADRALKRKADSILHDLVVQGDMEAKQVFLARLAVRS